MANNVRDPLPNGSEPAKKRAPFLLCFAAALLLVVSAFTGALLFCMTNTGLFQQAIADHVNLTGLGIEAADAERFATETIGYLQGASDRWEPSVPISGGVMPIPDSFKAHMANVRGWVKPAPAAVLIGLIAAFLLLGLAMAGGRGARRRAFSLKGYYLGAALPLALLAGVIGWACISFESMWAWLHVTFIPDGIFPMGEPIMQLFPTGLFMSYLLPVGLLFTAALAVILALPLLLTPLAKRIAAHRLRTK